MAEWARIPKRAKPWAATELAVQQKRAQEQLAVGLAWFSKQPSVGKKEPQDNVEDYDFAWDGNQYSAQQNNRNAPWLAVP